MQRWSAITRRPTTGSSPKHRVPIGESLGGLRYVRNNMGHHIDHVDFVQGAPRSRGRAPDRIANWTWRPLPEPCLSALSPRAQEWEMQRYSAYQQRLADHPVGEAAPEGWCRFGTGTMARCLPAG